MDRKTQQAAGRIGIRMRWRYVLEWHRDLEHLRNGFQKDKNWKLRLRHVEVRYIALWRSGGNALSDADRDELDVLSRHLGTWHIKKIALIVRSFGEWRIPMLNIHWSNRGLERLLNVTGVEARKLELMKQSRQLEPPMPPGTIKRQQRRIEVERSCRALARWGITPTVQGIQDRLKSKGISVSTRTIRRDLKHIGK